MVKKILVIIFSVLIFNACSIITKSYSYNSSDKLPFLIISGNILNEDDENSPLESFWIRDKRNNNTETHEIKLLSNTIKLVKNGKEYIIPYSNPNNYKDIYKNGVNITDGDFIAYIGKIQLDNGKIVNLPPLHFKKYIYIQKNGVLAGIDSIGRFKSYSGTVEEYKKSGWKEE